MPTTAQLPYSVHSFMLPFRWDYLPEGFSFDKGREYFSFEERTDLKQFLHCLLDGHSRWKRKFYCIDGKKEKYNEFHYFHSYVAKTIFDLQQPDEKTENKVNPNKVMVYFQYNTDVDTDTFHIHTAKKNTGDKDEEYSYTLAIREISLHVYNTGVAILGIHLNNNKYREKEQVCRINEFGRRLYPQFLNDGPKATEKVKEAFLPLRVEMVISGAPIMEDDFSEYDEIDNREVYHYDNKRTEYQRTWVTKMPQYIRKLFGTKFAFSSQDYLPDAIALNVLTDDRMFFMCWHGNNQFASAMTNINPYHGEENKKKSIGNKRKKRVFVSI